VERKFTPIKKAQGGATLREVSPPVGAWNIFWDSIHGLRLAAGPWLREEAKKIWEAARKNPGCLFSGDRHGSTPFYVQPDFFAPAPQSSYTGAGKPKKKEAYALLADCLPAFSPCLNKSF
jgi:hypothetical protein